MTLVITRPSPAEVKREAEAIRDASVRIAESKESAVKYLRENGYITKGGRLTKTYRK